MVLLLLSVSLLSSLTEAQTQFCKSGNTKNTAYMLREGDRRCEGLVDPEASSSEFNLRSFVIGQLQPSNKLTLEIPKFTNLAKPQVRIQSTQRYYQLYSLELKDKGNQWQFQWTNDVLRQENVALNSLRSIAQAGDVILPVIFSKPSQPAYDIRIYTGNRAKRITLQILATNSTILYSKTLTNRPGDEVSFAWNGHNQQGKPVPAGRYTLKVTAQIEQRNAPPDTRDLTRQFAHNPTWLR